jgi:hypothetical protein
VKKRLEAVFRVFIREIMGLADFAIGCKALGQDIHLLVDMIYMKFQLSKN